MPVQLAMCNVGLRHELLEFNAQCASACLTKGRTSVSNYDLYLHCIRSIATCLHKASYVRRDVWTLSYGVSVKSAESVAIMLPASCRQMLCVTQLFSRCSTVWPWACTQAARTTCTYTGHLYLQRVHPTQKSLSTLKEARSVANTPAEAHASSPQSTPSCCAQAGHAYAPTEHMRVLSHEPDSMTQCTHCSAKSALQTTRTHTSGNKGAWRDRALRCAAPCSQLTSSSFSDESVREGRPCARS